MPPCAQSSLGGLGKHQEVCQGICLKKIGKGQMVKKLSDVERDAMELTGQERAILAKHLLATLDPVVDVDAEELWLQEAEKRNAKYRAGKITSKPADQVFGDAKQSLQ